MLTPSLTALAIFCAPPKCQDCSACQPPILNFCPGIVQKEASEVFFSVTKLYQSKDANLRRMVYLVIKVNVM